MGFRVWGIGFRVFWDSELQSPQKVAQAQVMRRDAEKAKDYAKRHGVARWYTTVEDVKQGLGFRV